MSKKKIDQTKHILIAVYTLLIVSVIITCILYYNSHQRSDSDIVLTINDEPVTKAEFISVMSSLKGTVYSRFAQKNGVCDSKDFWKTDFNGEIPIDILKQETIHKLKRVKIEQILMKNNGIVSDISYKGFLWTLKSENQGRKNATAQKKPIFGPEKYDELVFYDVLHQNRLEELKKKLAQGELTPSDTEKKYNEILDKFIKEAQLVMNEKIFEKI